MMKQEEMIKALKDKGISVGRKPEPKTRLSQKDKTLTSQPVKILVKEKTSTRGKKKDK